MKRIRALEEPTPGLSEYTTLEQEAATWEGFGSHRGTSDAKRELAEALADIQLGLCGYCEINLLPQDREIEHVVPRSDTARGGAQRALDCTNLIACCRGNAGMLGHPDNSGDSSRFRSPIRAHRSCGHAKGDTSDPAFLDPREVPALPSLFRVTIEGEITADIDACWSNRVGPARVERTIEILGLNVPRLREARAARWRDLQAEWDLYDDDWRKIRAAASRELLPGGSHKLPRFFTTTRSFFGALAEEILKNARGSWV